MFRKYTYCLLIVLLVSPALAAQRPSQAAVATAHPLATQAGVEILKAGGNAFDAAVAVTAAIGVVEPYGSGLGGGGFWLLHRAEDGFEVMVDGRETAPGAAHRDMYLDARGEVIPNASIDGALAAGIPGVPAAMVHIARRYGLLPLSKTLAPAIRLARDGFEVDEHYRRYAGFRVEILRRYPATAKIFLRDDEIPPVGFRLKQPDLAITLEAVATTDGEAFYRGELARRMVQGVRKAGGIWTLDDLRNYRVVERPPVRSHYRGMTITSAAPPSSGGIALAEMFNMLSRFDLASMNAADRAHLNIEIMRRAYRDRAEYLGDDDVVEVPVARLTSAGHARRLAQTIRLDRATPSDELAPVARPGGAGADTTHFSVLDQAGNRVAATLSINYPFGACFVVPGTGVLLNDEMDDFSAKPGVPNAYGLVGAEANAIAPGKRPLSSMSPTFLEDARGVAILGTPGGSRIITMVLLSALEYAAGGDARQLVERPRYHHQYLPDEVVFEPSSFSAATRQALVQRGHVLKPQQAGYGNLQAVVWDRRRNVVSAASDSRGIGQAALIR